MSYRRPPLAAEYAYVVYDSIRTTVKFRQVPSRGLKESDDTSKMIAVVQGTIPNFGFTLDSQLGSVRIEIDTTPKTGLRT
jgi:hypothetical protein